MRSNITIYKVEIFGVEEIGGTAQRHNFGNIYEFEVGL
jgi:hypothetical protein